ncbi:MAG: ABC transporter ATP-binding protein [Clostridia bacterium]
MAILEVQGINVKYAKFELLDVTFSCFPGEVVALVGKNGAGKTTTIDAILGLTKTCAGVVRYDGEEINERNSSIFKQTVGYVGSCTEYYPDVSIQKIVKFLSDVYKNWNQGHMNHYLDMFQIDITKKMKELSTGTQVKFSLAVALSHLATLLILDEPTTGLDPIVREQVLELLKSLAHEKNITVLFSSHITQDIEKIATKILFLLDGKIVLNISKDELKSRYMKISTQALHPDHKDVLDKCVRIGDQYVVMSRLDAPASLMKQIDEHPLLIEDVLIYLNGGIK